MCFKEFIHFFQIVQFVSIQLFVTFSYNHLYFCSASCYLSSFISDFIYLGPLSFFLDESGERICQSFLIFSKNQLLVSPIFCMALLDSISFISSPIFIKSLPFTHFGLGLLFIFKLFLMVKLDCLFEIFLVSHDRCVKLKNSPLGLLSLCPIEFGWLCSYFHLFQGIF